MTCISKQTCTIIIPSLKKVAQGMSEKRLVTHAKCGFSPFLGYKIKYNYQLQK